MSFKNWPEGQTSPVVHAFRDAVSETTLTVAIYPSQLPVRELKRRAARAYSSIYREFRVTRNEQLAGLGREAWLLELNLTADELKLVGEDLTAQQATRLATLVARMLAPLLLSCDEL